MENGSSASLSPTARSNAPKEGFEDKKSKIGQVEIARKGDLRRAQNPGFLWKRLSCAFYVQISAGLFSFLTFLFFLREPGCSPWSFLGGVFFFFFLCVIFCWRATVLSAGPPHPEWKGKGMDNARNGFSAGTWLFCAPQVFYTKELIG